MYQLNPGNLAILAVFSGYLFLPTASSAFGKFDCRDHDAAMGALEVISTSTSFDFHEGIDDLNMKLRTHYEEELRAVAEKCTVQLQSQHDVKDLAARIEEIAISTEKAIQTWAKELERGKKKYSKHRNFWRKDLNTRKQLLINILKERCSLPAESMWIDVAKFHQKLSAEFQCGPKYDFDIEYEKVVPQTELVAAVNDEFIVEQDERLDAASQLNQWIEAAIPIGCPKMTQRRDDIKQQLVKEAARLASMKPHQVSHPEHNAALDDSWAIYAERMDRNKNMLEFEHQCRLEMHPYLEQYESFTPTIEERFLEYVNDDIEHLRKTGQQFWEAFLLIDYIQHKLADQE